MPFFFEGRVLWSQDIGRVYYPVATLLRQVLVTLDPSPLLWNPNLGAGFPLVFGAIALSIAIASLTNAQLVERLGMRRLSHASLAGFIGLSAATPHIDTD